MSTVSSAERSRSDNRATHRVSTPAPRSNRTNANLRRSPGPESACGSLERPYRVSDGRTDARRSLARDVAQQPHGGVCVGWIESLDGKLG